MENAAAKERLGSGGKKHKKGIMKTPASIHSIEYEEDTPPFSVVFKGLSCL